MMGTYSKPITQQRIGDATIKSDGSLTCVMMIVPEMGWFEIVEVPKFYLDEVKGSNDEYIDKSYVRVTQLFNNTWICRYPYPRKVVFDNGCDFKRDFTPLIKYFDVKPVLTTIKTQNPTLRWSGCIK